MALSKFSHFIRPLSIHVVFAAQVESAKDQGGWAGGGGGGGGGGWGVSGGRGRGGEERETLCHRALKQRRHCFKSRSQSDRFNRSCKVKYLVSKLTDNNSPEVYKFK